MKNVEDYLNDLKSVLLIERDVLLSGSYGRLTSIIATKQAAVQDVEKALSGPVNEGLKPLIKTVQSMAKDNERLLAAAINGARSARRRLLSISTEGDQIGAYDSAGGQVLISKARSPYNKMV